VSSFPLGSVRQAASSDVKHPCRTVDVRLCCKQQVGTEWVMPNGFKGRHFPADFILLCVRWYLKFNVSYRHLAEMMQERGFEVHHTTS
jgi:hypothetical protein